MEVREQNAISPGWDGWWVNPRDSKFKYADLMKFDVAEAKKLIRAATGKDTLDTEHHWMNGPEYTQTYTDSAQLVMSFLNQGGIKGKSAGHAYQTDYLPNYYYAYSPAGRDKTYNGLTLLLDRTYPTVVSQLFAVSHSSGARFHGMSPDGSDPTKGDPKINDLIQKMKVEFDMEKAKALGREFQESIINKMYYVPGGPYPTLSTGFSLVWPAVGNYLAFPTWGGSTTSGGIAGVQPGVTEGDLQMYLDQNKPPFKKA